MNKNADVPDHIRDMMLSKEDYANFNKMAQGFVVSCNGDTNITPCIAIAFRGEANRSELQHAIVGVALGDAWNEYSTRVQTLKDLASKFLSEGNTPMAVAMVSEAWASNIPIEDKDKPRMMPRDDPNRREVAIVSAMTIDGRNTTAIATITRDAEEKMTIGEFDVNTGDCESILEHFFRQIATDLTHKHGTDYRNN